MVFTEPPPPEPSTRRISGRRRSWAIRSHWLCLPLMVASAEPPRTVKSSPPITTGRPSTSARPNTKFDGVSATRSFLLVVARAARDLADLVEGAGVRELGDPLADGQPPAVVLPLDALGPAELLGERLAAPQLVHLLLPVHAARPVTLLSTAIVTLWISLAQELDELLLFLLRQGVEPAPDVVTVVAVGGLGHVAPPPGPRHYTGRMTHSAVCYLSIHMRYMRA